jgi:peptidoglycan/xylan/chitin deacetylase (PgdA/CDA1 family)
MYAAIENELPRLEDFVSAADLLDSFAGMTEEQLNELASDPLFSLGIHTVDHPILTICRPEEAYRQIAENKHWIERITNKACNVIAYPLGDYNAEVVRQCQDLGIHRGYALIPSMRVHPEYEISRIGIFGQSIEFMGFKVQWGAWVRSIQSAIGKQSIDFSPR